MIHIYNRPLISPLQARSPTFDRNHPQSAPRSLSEFDDSSHGSIRRPERNGWTDGLQSSSMDEKKDLSIEVPSPIVGDMYQSRHENPPKPAREQLPPLSSIFGAASSQGRHAQSPYSERHSPVFSTTSTHSARFTEGSYDSSYFQRPPVARQYSHDSRPESVDRHSIPPPPKPTSLGVRPTSPRFEPRHSAVDNSRPATSANGWSPHSQPSRTEYFSRDTSSSFRPQPEHHAQPGSVHRNEIEVRQPYRSAPGPSNYPPTPASTVSGDVATGKDGLGPKIWTGTQFLPRFVRQAEMPGEGMCYFYDDGTHCKTVIDGEVVNAHWGVTKAGKPRKRLAIACITCREKKIKCDPDFPRCVQCEKFGRVCKFKNAPRGGQGSPETPPADTDDLLPRPTSSRTEMTAGEPFPARKVENSRSVSPRQVRARSIESESHQSQHSKRQRNGYNDFTPVASEASPRSSYRKATPPPTTWTAVAPIDPQANAEWHKNPFNTHPALVTELASIFFNQLPETAYYIFPEGPFKTWLLSDVEKSEDDLMIIHTVLALGTVFSQKPEHKPLGVQFAATARAACDNRRFSLQLVQSRLLLALYYFAQNNPNDAWDFCGAALRAASGLKMNLEWERTDDAKLTTYPYGLNRSGWAESRRRTYWSCYNMDRFNGFCSGHLSVVNPQDIFLRLPCNFKLFESQADVQAPFFDLNNPPPSSENWSIDHMAYLINISTIWGDVMANIYRTSNRHVPLTSNSTFVPFYETINQRLHAWQESLPPSYTFSPTNLKIAADSGKLGTFTTMHAVYHTTAVKLNRYIQKSTFSAAQLAHHILLAKQHAHSILNISDTLAASRLAVHSSPAETDVKAKKFSSPFVGYAIVAAVDVLTAKFPLSTVSSLLASLNGVQSILGEIASSWQSGKRQSAMILKRVHELQELAVPDNRLAKSDMGRESEGIFEMAESVDKTISRDYDCFYE